MPITTYSSTDLFSISKTVVQLVNAADIGSGFNLNISGSDIKANPAVIAECIAQIRLSAGIDHTSPTNPIPATARIYKITVSFQDNALINASSSQLTPPSSGTITNTAAYHFHPFAYGLGFASNNWITSSDPVVAYDHGDSASGSANASFSAGHIVEAIYDFTLNPVGAFPLGYCSYSTFIANFSTARYRVDYLGTNAGVQGSFVGGTWSLGVSAIYTSTNWQMEVVWSLPSPWIAAIPSPTKVGDIIEIATDPAVNINLADVDQISFSYGTKVLDINKDLTFVITDDGAIVFTMENSPWIIEWELDTIKIKVPYGFGDYEGPVVITARTFSGSYIIGIMDIVFVDTSGIYKITPGKLNDTLYNRDGETTDVAILKPYFRTGFIDG